MVIKKKALELLKHREFISVATCDFHGQPNAASKFILRIENDSIYLVDYIIGRTFQNLRINPPRLAFLRRHRIPDRLPDQRRVVLMEHGPEYEEGRQEFEA